LDGCRLCFEKVVVRLESGFSVGSRCFFVIVVAFVILPYGRSRCCRCAFASSPRSVDLDEWSVSIEVPELPPLLFTQKEQSDEQEQCTICATQATGAKVHSPLPINEATLHCPAPPQFNRSTVRIGSRVWINSSAI
jgi:hypothetical protein